MVRITGAAVVAAGLAGVTGCASTARPMVFQRNHVEPAPYLGDPGMAFAEGPILSGGMPMASMPVTTMPVTVPPPAGGTIIGPAPIATPGPTAPPPPIGPQPRTTPGTGTGQVKSTK
jgi:hypothetical protein